MSKPLSTDGPLGRILDLADDAIITMRADQRIVLFNKGAERIFGYAEPEILNQPLDVLLPAGMEQAHRRHVEQFAAGEETSRRMGERREIYGRRKDGTEFPAEASISKAEADGELLFTVILRDVTARREAEERIRQSLREKEALLQEIHHRVKNNLQVVSSLLGLQARQIPDEELQRAFRESQNRIHSMSLIHERLYQSPDLSEIDCLDYAQQLTGHLFRSYGVSMSRVRLEMDFGGERMPMALAAPVGLILNELISNCLKHAFPEGRDGTIQVRLTRDGDGRIQLSVSDDGVGMPQNVNLWNSRSLGLRLVRILSEQVGAAVRVTGPPGTRIELAFTAREAGKK